MANDPLELDSLRQAAKIAGLGHYLWDVVADKCLFCSEEHADIHGMSVADYIARSSTLQGLSHPDDLPHVQEAFRNLRAGEPFELEYRIITPDGELRYIREIGHPVFDEEGTVVREVGTSQNITDQKLREITLQEAEAAIYTSIEALPFGFASYGPDDRLEFFNSEYKRLLPFSASLLKPGMHIEDLMRRSAHIIAPACGYEDVEEYVQARLSSTRQTQTDWTYQQSNGRWVCNTKTLKADGGFLSILRDITDQKMQERQLAQDQSMKAVGLLTGGISHDFNNLLSVAAGSLELLEKASGEAERAELAKTAARAVENGAVLTRQMLALGRRSPLLGKPTDLRHAIEEFISFAKRALPATISIEGRLPEAQPVAVVDQGMLQNALLNLALNSKAAMPDGGTITVETGLLLKGEPDQPQRHYAYISVADTGVGISGFDLEQVFEPFFTTRDVGQGSGLGLSMVKGFIEQSQGEVQIESTPGCGTVVTLLLPASFEEPVEANVRSPVSVPVPQKGTKRRVLVVEDNPQLLALVAMQLERDGFIVTKALSGDEAVQHLSDAQDVDAVLTDAVMPGTHQGVDVLKHAKALNPQTPVILMSGYADVRRNSATDLRRADLFIEKPLKLSELSHKVSELIALTEKADLS